MATLPGPKPQFFKYVDKPDNVGDAELSRARPVYIDGLPEFALNHEDDAAEFDRRITAIEARLDALDAASG